jgi:hypothetical protein
MARTLQQLLAQPTKRQKSRESPEQIVPVGDKCGEDHARHARSPTMMATRVASLLIASALTTAAAPSAQPTCIEVREHVRRTAFGYDHLATVTNGCGTRMRCFIETEAVPEQVRVTLDAGASQTVVTLRGSPSRRIKTVAHCEPIPPPKEEQ